MKLVAYLQKKHGVTRREFSQMLKEWAVTLNNQLVESYDQVVAADDKLQVALEWDDIFKETIKLSFHPPRIVLFNKPKGFVCSKDDPHNKTIYDILPDSRRKDFYYIWRLDKESVWLMLLTNQPELVDRYENPKNDIHKVYEVQIDKPYRTKDVRKAKNWINLNDHGEIPEKWEFSEMLSFHHATYKRDSKWRFRLVITLNEWKKRHIRRVLRYLWYKVYVLRRIKVGKRHLWDLKLGKWKMEKKLK